MIAPKCPWGCNRGFPSIHLSQDFPAAAQYKRLPTFALWVHISCGLCPLQKCEGAGAGGRSFWRWLQRIKGPLLPGRCVPPRACGTLTRLAGDPRYTIFSLI